MNGKYCTSARELTTIVFGQCLILWCCQVVADESQSGFQTLRLWDHFSTVVHSLGPPKFCWGK